MTPTMTTTNKSHSRNNCGNIHKLLNLYLKHYHPQPQPTPCSNRVEKGAKITLKNNIKYKKKKSKKKLNVRE